MDVFVRQNGVFGGICGGLAAKFGLNVVLIRFLMLVSAFCSLGLTVILYLAALFAFPNTLSVQFGERPVFLGVCHRLAKGLNLHESWLRFLALLLWIFTGFLPVFAIYTILFLVMGGVETQIYQESHGSNSDGSSSNGSSSNGSSSNGSSSNGRVRDVN